MALFERQNRLPPIERVLNGGDEMDDVELEARIMAWAHSHNAKVEAAKRLGMAAE